MPNLQLTIPAQDKRHAGVRVKPRELRQWLDDLPYLDLPRAARLASEQLRLMNRQPLAAATRLEMLGSFLASYQRLLEALPLDRREAAPIEALLKRLSQDIGFGYKIVVHDLVNRRSRFMEGRHLPLALLGAIHALGLQLTDCYAHYRTAPRALWSECLALYHHARLCGRAGYEAELPGVGRVQIDALFRVVALLRRADPYRLPAGMIPLLQQYFSLHTDLCRIEEEAALEGVSLPLEDAPESDEGPVLYLNLGALLARMQQDIARLEQSGQSRAIGLEAGLPSSTLARTLRQICEHWQNQPARKAEREAVHTRVELVTDLDAAWCVLNQGRCFDPALFQAPDHEDDIDLGAIPATGASATTVAPQPFLASTVDRSSGGVAIRYRGEARALPRIGQLAALRRPGSGGDWVVAVYRWLIESDTGFDTGLQYLAHRPQPVAVRCHGGDGGQGVFQPALSASQRRGQQRIYTLIMRAGQTTEGGEVSVYTDKGRHRVRCSELLESGTGFDRFVCELL